MRKIYLDMMLPTQILRRRGFLLSVPTRDYCVGWKEFCVIFFITLSHCLIFHLLFSFPPPRLISWKPNDCKWRRHKFLRMYFSYLLIPTYLIYKYLPNLHRKTMCYVPHCRITLPRPTDSWSMELEADIMSDQI